jgi:iron complex transport system ATP-binding protein
VSTIEASHPSNLLRAVDVRVELGGRCVVDGVSLSVSRGEVLAVVGPNGSGKTTLLRALAGILNCGGEIELSGRPQSSFSRRALARELAYLPQETWTPFSPTVEDVVRLGRYAHAGALRPLQSEDRRAVTAAMERADVAHLRLRPLATLSGGERRRAHLARAIAQEAPLLVLDEPTTALDVGHACAVMDLVRGLAASGAAVIFSLHDVVLAPRGATRALLLDHGRAVAEGDPSDVLTSDAAHRAFGLRLVALTQQRAIVPL